MVKETLVGTWEKISDAFCCRDYPDSITFRDDGIYTGVMATPGHFARWDVGTYELVSDRQITLSTANDARITYRVSISDLSVTFIDPDGCEIRYQRSTGEGTT